MNRVTIQPHGQALGVTYQQPTDDRHNYDETYLRGRIIGALGGRAAEELIYKARTTGAESDMQQATSTARQMVTRWGMSDRLGPVTLAASDGGMVPEQEPQSTTPTWRAYSDDTARLIDAEIRRVLDESYASAVQLLGAHRSELSALASALLVRETLDEEEILEVTGLRRSAELLPVTATAPTTNNHLHESKIGMP